MPEGLIEDYEFFDDLQDGELAETDTSLMNNVMTYYLPLICLSDVHQAAPVTSQISAHMISKLTNNI